MALSPPEFDVTRRSPAEVLVGGAAAGVAGKLAGRGLQLILDVVLARLLGPVAFGLYAIGWVGMRVIGLISPLGLDKGAVRFGTELRAADPAGFRGLLGRFLGLSLLSGATAAGLLWLVSEPLAVGFFGKPELAPVFRGFSPAVAIFATLRVAAAFTRVTRRTHHAAISEDLTQPLANLLLLVGAHLLGWSLAGAVVACSASFGVALLLALVQLRRLFPDAFRRAEPARSPGPEPLLYSFSVALSGVAVLLLTWTDRLLLGALGPAADVGIYQAASQPAFLFSTLLIGFASILGPMFVDCRRRGDRAELETVFRLGTRWCLYASIPALAVIFLAPGSLIQVVFGSDYLPGVDVLRILAAGQAVNVATGSVGLLLMMSGQTRPWLIAAVGWLAFDVASNLWAIPRYGPPGAAASTAVSTAGLFVTGLGLVRARLEIWPYDRSYWKLVLGGALAAIGVLASRWLPWGEAVALVAGVALAYGVFAGAIVALGFTEEESMLGRRVLGRYRSGAGPER